MKDTAEHFFFFSLEQKEGWDGSSSQTEMVQTYSLYTDQNIKNFNIFLKKIRIYYKL